MARSFTSNHNVNFGDVPVVADASVLSFSGWAYANNTTQDHLVFANQSGGGEAGIQFYQDNVASSTGRTDTFKIVFVETPGAGGGLAQIEGATNAAQASVWQHLFVSMTPDDASGLQLWVDGSEDANSPVSTVGIADLGQSNDNLQFGETSGGSRDRNGYLAEFGFWNRVLSDSEVIALSKGYSPLMFPSGLIFYAPMIGKYSPEIDLVGGLSGTVTGATAVSHPPIIYPSTNLVLPKTSALPSVTPSVSDSASVSDTLPSYSQTEPVSVSDSATIEIVYPDLLPTVSDSVSVSDTPSLDPIEIVTSVSDSVSVSDSASISIQSVADTTVTASDTASVADTPVLTVSDPQAIASDTVSVTDSPTVSIQAVPDLNVSASDTASIADTLPSYEYTEPVSVIDSPTIQPQGEIVTRSVSASDTINVSEVFQAAIEVNASISDSVTVSDEPIISVVALDTPSASVSDLVGVTDTPTVSVQPTTTPEVTVSDSVSVSDSASVDIALDVTAQESVSVTDTATAKVSDLIMNISDSVSVSESVTLNVSGTPEVSVSDSVSVSENTSINIYTPGEKLSFIVLDLGQVIMEI